VHKSSPKQASNNHGTHEFLDIPKKKNEACYESYIVYINQMLNQNYPVLFVCLFACFFALGKLGRKLGSKLLLFEYSVVRFCLHLPQLLLHVDF
jgi:hypothetical protein